MVAVVVTMPEGEEPVVIGPIRDERRAAEVAETINARAEREAPAMAASVVPLVPAASDFEDAVFG